MKQIIVFGSKSGVGKELVSRLRAEVGDWDVVTADWRDSDWRQSSPRGENLDIPLPDLRNVALGEVKNCIHGQARDLILHPQYIVNCMGYNRLELFEDCTSTQFEQMMRVNVWSHIAVLQYFQDKLRHGGRLIEVISTASQVPMTHSLAYNMSKASQEMFVRQAARELTKSEGISIIGVSPTKIKNTAMSAYIDATVPAMRGWTRDEAHAYQLNSMLSGRELDADEVASMIHHLCSISSEQARQFSGRVIPIGA